MRNYIWIFLILCLVACQKEKLEPSNTPSSFAPDPEATDRTSEFRKEFYEATGCFLLFNDTLRHECLGQDANGQPYYETELLCLEWNVGTTSYSRYRFEYIRDVEEQEEVFLFLKDELYPVIKNMMPYSILAVKGIDEYDTSYGPMTYKASPKMYSNARCLALDVSELWTSDDLRHYALEILGSLLFTSWGGTPPYYNESEAAVFLSINGYDYGYEKDYAWPPLPVGLDLTEEEMEAFYEYGFLVNTSAENMPSAQEDAVSYIVACLSMTESEFKDKYGAYAKVMTKYELIKPLVDAAGIKIE